MTADALAHVHAHNPHAGQGAVMLDIGDDVGALSVCMPEEMVGEEVEIESDDPVVARAMSHDHGHGLHRQHVAVLPRPVPGGDVVPSLVFPALVEGSYRLFVKGSDVVALTADVVGGRVTTVRWNG